MANVTSRKSHNNRLRNNRLYIGDTHNPDKMRITGYSLYTWEADNHDTNARLWKDATMRTEIGEYKTLAEAAAAAEPIYQERDRERVTGVIARDRIRDAAPGLLAALERIANAHLSIYDEAADRGVAVHVVMEEIAAAAIAKAKGE